MSSPATTIEQQDGVIIVHVQVKILDDANTKAVHADLAAAAAASPEMPAVLDLASVKLLPSLTLGMIVRMCNEFRARGQRLALAALQPAVRDVMMITRLDRVFEIHDDVPSAIKSVAG